jgi:hypothetical protein
MGTTSSFFGGGGGGSPLPQPEWLFQKSSYTYTFPYDGTVIVHVIGAGGSGAAQSNGYGCTGAGAGGYSRKQFSVTSSTTATVTTGIGGKSVGNNATEAEGITGTSSSFVLGSDTLSANGGVGGNRYPNANVFAAGGTASGGDINYQGGRSGKLAYDWNEILNVTTGGGAVSLFGLSTNAVRAGDITAQANRSATGGGGVGGRGGDINVSITPGASGAGGSAGPGEDLDSPGNEGYRTSAGGAGGSRLFLFNGPFLDGIGGRGLFSSMNNSTGKSAIPSFGTTGIGAGTGGYVQEEQSQTNDGDLQPPTAGLFGGGGGASSNSNTGFAGHASLGGGGGGITSYTSSSMKRQSGAGGDGVVIIEYIERG